MRLTRYWGLLITALLVPMSAAKAEWREATSEHFVVVSAGSEQSLIRASQRLEAVHWMMTLISGVTPTANTQRVKIYLVADTSDVISAMGGNANSDVAGFYRSDEEGAIAVVPRSEGEFSTTVLYHEYAHHFMLQYLPVAYPPWFVEGFAEFVGTASFERAGSITIGKAATHRQAEIEFVRWVPVERMFARRSIEDREAGVASYGQYWIAAHYLLLNAERRAQLNRFIGAINRGVPEERAYTVFTGGLDQLNNDMQRYSRQTSFVGRLAALPADVQATPVVRTLRPGEAAIVALELQATRDLDTEQLTELAADIAEVVAQFPTDTAVLMLQAKVLFEMQDRAGVQAALDRVLAAEPDNARALAYRGWSYFLSNKDAATPESDALAAQARAMIGRAMELAPDDPVPLLANYYSYTLSADSVPREALDGLVRASDMVPQEEALRLSAALALISRGDLAGAARLLGPLAYAPHESSQQGQALLLLQWVRSGAMGTMPVYVAPIEVEVADE